MDPRRDIWWHEASAAHSSECDPEWVDAEHPLFLLYTSGSTGKPKGIQHSTAGYLLGATPKKTILFYDRAVERRISLLIVGNTHPNCMLVPYAGFDELEELVRSRVQSPNA